MIYIADVKIKKQIKRVAICNSAFGSFIYEFKKNGLKKEIDFEYALEDCICINEKSYKIKKVITYCFDFNSTKQIKKAVKKLFSLYGDFNLELFKILFTACEHRRKYWDKIVENFIEEGLCIGNGTIYKGYNGKLKGKPQYGWSTDLKTANCFGDFVCKIENASYKIVGGNEKEVIYLPNKKDKIILEKAIRVGV